MLKPTGSKSLYWQVCQTQSLLAQPTGWMAACGMEIGMPSSQQLPVTTMIAEMLWCLAPSDRWAVSVTQPPSYCKLRAVRKMEKKGCAVILLRNEQVLNFSVWAP